MPLQHANQQGETTQASNVGAWRISDLSPTRLPTDSQGQPHIVGTKARQNNVGERVELVAAACLLRGIQPMGRQYARRGAQLRVPALTRC